MNTELFERVLGRIEADPTSLDMAYWAVQSTCGTTACMAGHTVIEMGWHPVYVESAVGFADRAVQCSQGNATRVIKVLARDGLELTDNEAEALFNGTNPNDVEFLRRLGKRIAEGFDDEIQRVEDYRDQLLEEDYEYILTVEDRALGGRWVRKEARCSTST